MTIEPPGMHWHLHKDGAHFFQAYRARGQRMPVAVALGSDPAVTYASTAPLPEGLWEMVFAGFLRGKPAAIAKATLSDLDVPADAEFVLEGWIDPQETRLEGPFGDHTGFYSLRRNIPCSTSNASRTGEIPSIRPRLWAFLPRRIAGWRRPRNGSSCLS